MVPVKTSNIEDVRLVPQGGQAFIIAVFAKKVKPGFAPKIEPIRGRAPNIGISYCHSKYVHLQLGDISGDTAFRIIFNHDLES